VVHRDPGGGGYGSILRRRGGDLLQLAAVPAISMTAASIFA
jgi:hypothetical protein